MLRHNAPRGLFRAMLAALLLCACRGQEQRFDVWATFEGFDDDVVGPATKEPNGTTDARVRLHMAISGELVHISTITLETFDSAHTTAQQTWRSQNFSDVVKPLGVVESGVMINRYDYADLGYFDSNTVVDLYAEPHNSLSPGNTADVTIVLADGGVKTVTLNLDGVTGSSSGGGGSSTMSSSGP